MRKQICRWLWPHSPGQPCERHRLHDVTGYTTQAQPGPESCTRDAHTTRYCRSHSRLSCPSRRRAPWAHLDWHRAVMAHSLSCHGFAAPEVQYFMPVNPKFHWQEVLDHPAARVLFGCTFVRPPGPVLWRGPRHRSLVTVVLPVYTDAAGGTRSLPLRVDPVSQAGVGWPV